MGMIAVMAVMLASITRRLTGTRRLSSGLTTLALAGIVMLVAAGGASANGVCVWGDIGAGEYYECGDLVTQSCTLNASMDCTDETVCGLIIGADGITIDGAGYSMTGDLVNATCIGSQTSPCVTHSGVINTGGWDNVVVKNLEIKDFNTGVVIGTAGMGDTEENMTVTGCNIHDCGESVSVTHGIHLVGANYCTITKNEIHHIEGQGIAGGCGGGGNGIFMHGDTAQMSGIYGDYNNITCNYLHHNKKSGFFMKFQCMYCNISYNKATDNTQSGIMPKCMMSNYNTIEYNNMSGNTECGFYTAGSSNTIRYNTANNNKIGICLGTAGAGPSGGGNVITNNSACGNSDKDIGAIDPNSGYADSNTCDSSDLGGCDWSCGVNNTYLVSVYYDFDEDVLLGGGYSAASCTCDNRLSVGACCNLGLFNESGAGDHCGFDLNGYDVCILTPGTDPNDCAPIPEMATLVLFGLGLMMLVGYVGFGRRRND